ncbi:hypothetical protein [Streptomyces sp. WAC00263]|uniref:hypothetical protein n=1 Tax=Streptomyces sp. WAC00263 TaxID=1917422 RepID=UPI0015EE8E56|nr:hypothetical protein [Streptomyces sp. WAC00263]KAF5990694.1 hypothetical protein BOG92_000585 [Streptomyces sp. WAC00263]
MSDANRRARHDELGELLYQFAHDTEPLIAVASGVADVHHRVRRRGTRRRLGATVAVCAALLSVGLWALPPLLSEGPADRPEQTNPGFVSAASILPSPDSGGGLPRQSLLSPSALPWNSAYHWHTTATGDGSATPLPSGGAGDCTLSWFTGTGTEDQISRTYKGGSGATAQHRIVAYADNSTAQHAVTQLADALHGCGWHETRGPAAQDHGSTNAVLYEFVLVKGAGAPLRVTLVQADHRVAVLVLATRQVADHAHTDPRTERCLGQTVNPAQPQIPSPTGTGRC